ncbi:MAG: hypothetical protein HZC54_05920 [Verrucomicrobia bacterium]|nr:hypothetical protein [Verrucomicrobiota bacterium]
MCAFACALQASAAEGEFALRQCDFRGDHSVINLSHRTASGYAAFDSDKARRGSVTVFVKPGETPRVTFSCSYDSTTVERRFGRGTDKVITVDGATWEGTPDNTSRTTDWKVTVKPGWNDVNVRVTVLSNKQPVGELTQSFRIYAYVFEVQPAGQLEHPLPAETGNFFLEHPLVDAAGNLYVGARRGGGTALLRYDPSGRISVRYDIKSAMAIGGPMGVDDDGNLYAFIAENIVQFDRDGKFVKSVAALGWTANTATTEDLKTGTWPSRRGEDRRDEVLRQISPCASNWETAMVGDAIYFIAHTPENRNCSEGPHVLACVTVDGRAQILDKVTPASGVIRGPDGNLYMREPGKDENHGLLTYSPTGRLEQRRPIIGPRYQVFHGIDGAGFVYAGSRVWEPSLTSVKESAAVDNGRFRSVSQRRGPSYYVDLLTGQQSTSNSGHNDLASWMYRGAVYTAYAADLRIARTVSLAPGAAGAAPLPMLKRGKSRPAVASGATATQQGAVPPGQTTAVPPAAKQAGTQAGVPASQTQPAGASGALPGAATDTARAAESGEISDDSQPVEPESAAAAALAASAAAAAGAWLTLLTSGMRWRDVMDGLRGIGSGVPVAAPPPPQPAPPVIPQEVHRDGEVNEQGDVWSREERGWVARDQYERNKKREQWLADKAVADLHAGQSEDVKQAYDKWQDSKQKLAEVREQGRLLEKTEKLREWVEQSEKANAEQSYWSDVKNNFVLNVEKEFNELPEQTFELCRAAAKTAKAGVDAAVDLARDATNWEILRATGAQTAKDLIGSPIQSAKKVNKFYTEAAKKAGGAVVQMVAHPVDTLKAVTGYENWAKALDPNVPLAKRMGYALMGTVDTVSTFGGALVTKPGAAALRGVEAADKLVDAAKAEMLANKLDDVARLGGDDLARHEAWLAGEQQARDRVAKLSAANTKQEVRAAVLEIQGDKRAIQMMNRQGKGMKGAFNEEIRGIYKQTDAAVEKRLKDSLAQKGVDLDRYELKPTHATNPSKDPFKIGADRDVTYSIYDKKTGQWVRDVPAGKVQEVYNEEFYRAAHGTRPASAKEAAEFAQKMDQQCVDALHKEAYGRGPADLKTALHEPGAKFSDPTQVGKAVAYKSHEWYEKAENAMSAGKAVEAEKLMSEGFRQTTKQFDNMLVRRHGALAGAGAQGLKNIPERMQEAIGVLKSAEKGVSPVAIEQKLRQLGYTSPRDVATHVGEYIEAMDKLRPPVKPTGGAVGLRDVASAAQTIASAAPNQQQQQ